MPFRAAFALPALVLALALAPDLIRPACARTLQAEHPSALPLPSEASPELRKLLAVNPLYGFWKQNPPADAKAWKALAAEQAAKTAPHVEALAGKLGVDVREASLGGARVFELAPKDVDPAMEGRVLLHLHGGGFVFNPGLAGAGEGVMMAAAGRVRVVSVDYRMPPEHPFPAA